MEESAALLDEASGWWVAGTHDNAIFGQNIANVHLALAMVASRLAPEPGCMRRPGLADRGNDALSSLQ